MSGENLLFYKEAKKTQEAGANTAYGLGIAVGGDALWQALALKPVVEDICLDKDIIEFGHNFGTLTPESFLSFAGFPIIFAALSGAIYYLWMKHNVIPGVVDKQIETEKLEGLQWWEGVKHSSDDQIRAAETARRAALTQRLLEQEYTNAKHLARKVGLSIAGYVLVDYLVLDLILDSWCGWGAPDEFAGLFLGLGAAAGVWLAFRSISSKDYRKTTEYIAEQQALFITVTICGGAWYGFYQLAHKFGSASLEKEEAAGLTEISAEVAAVVGTFIAVMVLFKYLLPHLTAGFLNARENVNADGSGTKTAWLTNFASDSKAFVNGVITGPEIKDDEVNGQGPLRLDIVF